MNKYTILMCDDVQPEFGKVSSKVRALRESYPFVEDLQRVTFKNILEENYLEKCNADLLILDLWDDQTKKWLGKDCLELINTYKLQIKTIIFTGDNEGPEKKIDFSKEYPFVVEVCDKNVQKVEGLGNRIEKYILEKLPRQYILANEFDLLLQYQIQHIGERNLSELLKKIKDQFSIKDNIVVFRMGGGFSGATLFKINLEKTGYILKAFTDQVAFRKELDNATNQYIKFPTRFFNHISLTQYSTADKSTYAILIKLIDDSITLFEWLDALTDVDRVAPVLTDIFLADHSLRSHYKTHVGAEIQWNEILQKFAGERSSFIETVYKELKPLVDSASFDVQALAAFTRGWNFSSLSTYSNNSRGKRVLCHGDLHSRNILLQGIHPFLIDTGNMSLDIWCADISRLVVDLFINGLDSGTSAYYDIGKIDEMVDEAKMIIAMQPINESKNSPAIRTAINWLIENTPLIYGDLFDIFQFKLCLFREFLTFTYRTETVPPNRRAIALRSAFECIKSAEEVQRR